MILEFKGQIRFLGRHAMNEFFCEGGAAFSRLEEPLSHPSRRLLRELLRMKLQVTFGNKF
jgi:hypothetical protein